MVTVTRDGDYVQIRDENNWVWIVSAIAWDAVIAAHKNETEELKEKLDAFKKTAAAAAQIMQNDLQEIHKLRERIRELEKL